MKYIAGRALNKYGAYMTDDEIKVESRRETRNLILTLIGISFVTVGLPVLAVWWSCQ